MLGKIAAVYAYLVTTRSQAHVHVAKIAAVSNTEKSHLVTGGDAGTNASCGLAIRVQVASRQK